MPESRRQATQSTSTNSSNSQSGAPPRATTSVRRNLFHSHLRASRLTSRDTSASASTSAETLRLDTEPDARSEGSDIVIRDQNGEFSVGDPMHMTDVQLDRDDAQNGGEEGEGNLIGQERQRLREAVRSHQRDRQREPSEPAELLEAVRASLRAKVVALSEDNWLYEAEDEQMVR